MFHFSLTYKLEFIPGEELYELLVNTESFKPTTKLLSSRRAE